MGRGPGGRPRATHASNLLFILSPPLPLLPHGVTSAPPGPSAEGPATSGCAGRDGTSARWPGGGGGGYPARAGRLRRRRAGPCARPRRPPRGARTRGQRGLGPIVWCKSPLHPQGGLHGAGLPLHLPEGVSIRYPRYWVTEPASAGCRVDRAR